MHFFEIDLVRLIPGIAHWGYLGSAAALFIEGLSIPFPGGTFLLIYGFLASQGTISLPLAILSASLGYTAACSVPYWIGRQGGRPLLLNYGRYVGITPKRFQYTEKWFHHFGTAAVALGRLLFFRNYISYFAGIVRMPVRYFYFYTWIGILPWVVYMTLFGYILGNNWRYALELISRYSWASGFAILAALLIIYLLFRTVLRDKINSWMDQ